MHDVIMSDMSTLYRAAEKAAERVGSNLPIPVPSRTPNLRNRDGETLMMINLRKLETINPKLYQILLDNQIVAYVDDRIEVNILLARVPEEAAKEKIKKCVLSNGLDTASVPIAKKEEPEEQPLSTKADVDSRTLANVQLAVEALKNVLTWVIAPPPPPPPDCLIRVPLRVSRRFRHTSPS